MRVLIAYGSKMGGTGGIAAAIANRLEELGFDADCKPAPSVKTIDPYDAVIVGGGLYAGRWYKDARRFVKKHRKALSSRPAWLFSSGPLDETAIESVIPPTKQVRGYMELIGARGHMTFGGKLDANVKGFPASAMAKEMSGDFRDVAHIRQWADGVGSALRSAVRR